MQTDAAPSSPRYGARAIAALFALGLLSVATGGFQEVSRQDNASLVGRGPAFVLVCGIPAALALSLLWWAWRGWALSPEPRWIVAIRWGMAGAVLWSVSGTAAIVGWFSLILHRDAGLLPIVAFLSAPIGFVIGAVWGVRRR
jgi:hypothetical protein